MKKQKLRSLVLGMVALLVLALSVSNLCSSVALIADADAGEGALTIASVQGVRGDEITVCFKLTKASPVKAFIITDITYDADVFTLVNGGITVEGELSDWDPVAKEAVYADDTNNNLNNLDIFYLTFKVADDAALGIYEVDCDAVFKIKTDIGQEREIPVQINAGSIQINDGKKADYNEDNRIDSDDAIYLLKVTLSPQNYNINQSADADGNGIVDESDAIYLLKHTLKPDRYPLRAYQPTGGDAGTSGATVTDVITVPPVEDFVELTTAAPLTEPQSTERYLVCQYWMDNCNGDGSGYVVYEYSDGYREVGEIMASRPSWI